MNAARQQRLHPELFLWYYLRVESPTLPPHDYRAQPAEGQLAGGLGWELQKSVLVEPRRPGSLRNQVLVYQGHGIYLSEAIYVALEVDPVALESPLVRINKTTFYQFNRAMSWQAARGLTPDGNKDDLAEFKRLRNAGILNVLLGLARQYQLPPWEVK